MNKFLRHKIKKKENTNQRWILSASTEKILSCCEDVLIQHGKKPTVVWGLLKKTFFLHITSHGMKITPSLWDRVWFLSMLQIHSAPASIKNQLKITLKVLLSVWHQWWSYNSSEKISADAKQKKQKPCKVFLQKSSPVQIKIAALMKSELTAINHHF